MLGIRDAFTVTWSALRLFWEELFTFVICNLLVIALCIPVLTAPAAIVALYYVCDLAARDKAIAIRDFFTGYRQYFLKGTLLILLDVLLGFLLVSNILFYGQFEATWAIIVRAIWIAITFFWALIQVYLVPMFVVQIEPKIRTAWKNAALMVLAQPFFCAAIAVILLTVAVLSLIFIIPAMTFGMSLAALISSVALNNRLDALGIRKRPADEDPSS
ncbi:MAG: DUF624 domain-containing protein [Anaerolineae bacterium]